MGAAAGAIGAIASGVGSLVGGSGGGEQIDTAFIDEAKSEALSFLDDSLRAALPYSESFTERALSAQREQFALARGDIKEYYELSQAQTAPYREAGYQALDTLQDTLGMARLSSGSSAMAHAMENRAKEKAARSRMQQSAITTAQQLGMSPEDQMKFVQSATYGGNLPGLTRALQQYQLAGGGSPQGGLSATQAPLPHEIDPNLPPSDRLARTNPYQNMLSASGGRFDSDPTASFLNTALPLSQELARASNNMSSRQRVLANLGQTGYSHLTPVVTDV
jgi:hypothetical protein